MHFQYNDFALKCQKHLLPKNREEPKEDSWYLKEENLKCYSFFRWSLFKFHRPLSCPFRFSLLQPGKLGGRKTRRRRRSRWAGSSGPCSKICPAEYSHIIGRIMWLFCLCLRPCSPPWACPSWWPAPPTSWPPATGTPRQSPPGSSQRTGSSERVNYNNCKRLWSKLFLSSSTCRPKSDSPLATLAMIWVHLVGLPLKQIKDLVLCLILNKAQRNRTLCIFRRA